MGRKQAERAKLRLNVQTCHFARSDRQRNTVNFTLVLVEVIGQVIHAKTKRFGCKKSEKIQDDDSSYIFQCKEEERTKQEVGSFESLDVLKQDWMNGKDDGGPLWKVFSVSGHSVVVHYERSLTHENKPSQIQVMRY